MEIKPLERTTNTINIIASTTNLKKIDQKIIKDPQGIIPTGIYRVIHWEVIRQKITLIFLALLNLMIAIWITLFVLVYQTSWISFVIPIALMLISLYKFAITLVESRAIKKAVTRYRQDLRYNLSSTPPFLASLYLSLHKKQVAHNWITFTSIFYGGIITLLLWWLKDVQWWIFNFKDWISSLFANPLLMSWLFTAGLIIIALLHIIMSVQRKKKILEIDAFYGLQLAPASEVEQIKALRNKAYRRVFLLSLLVLLVIPLIVRIIYKIVTRRRR